LGVVLANLVGELVAVLLIPKDFTLKDIQDMERKMKTKKLFLVNRHTGESLEWNYQFGKTLPHYSFFNTGKFLNKGQVVELVELEELETEYFGIMRRTDN